ncbi:hypothetical protein JYU34_015984 [Plutella xylostella]|uniref:Uncharacterized protein n=1 Tax=Plutella xylostella TaxID=51655 RepID=A0ABQ7Q5F4_PLUXY|nr:hypothetical protein JYU34_015984 [Plutella xylostella]
MNINITLCEKVKDTMVWCPDALMEDDDMDDPITLVPDDMSKLLPAGSEVYSPSKTLDDTGLLHQRAENKASEETVQHTSYAEKNFLLPVTFFDIARNVRLLTECRPLTVQMVDYVKNPQCMKKQVSKIICSTRQIAPYKNNNALQDLVHGEMSTKSVVLNSNTSSFDCDLTDPCKISPIEVSTKNPEEYQHITSTTQPLNEINNDYKTPGNFNLGSKIQKRKPGPKRFTHVDFKKNQGLVGLKIIRKSELSIQQVNPTVTRVGTASSCGTENNYVKQNCNIGPTNPTANKDMPSLDGNITSDSFLGGENVQKHDKQSTPSFLNVNPANQLKENVSLSIKKITTHSGTQKAQSIEWKGQFKEGTSYPSFIKVLNKETNELKNYIDDPNKSVKQKVARKIKNMKGLIHVHGDVFNTKNTKNVKIKNSSALKNMSNPITIKEKPKSKIDRHKNVGESNKNTQKNKKPPQINRNFNCTVSNDNDNTLPAKIVPAHTSYPPGLSNVDIGSINNNRSAVTVPNPQMNDSPADTEKCNRIALNNNKDFSQARAAEASEHCAPFSQVPDTSHNSFSLKRKSQCQDYTSSAKGAISKIGNNCGLLTVLSQKDLPKMGETDSINGNANNVAKLCELKIKTVSQINYKIAKDLYNQTSHNNIQTKEVVTPNMKTKGEAKNEVKSVVKPCQNMNPESHASTAQESVTVVGKPIQSVTRVYNKVNPHPDPKQYVSLNVAPFQSHSESNRELINMGPLPTTTAGISEQSIPKVERNDGQLRSHNNAHPSYIPNYETPTQFGNVNILNPNYVMPESNQKEYFANKVHYYENTNSNAIPPYQMRTEQFPLQHYGNYNYPEWTHRFEENFANTTWQQPQLAYSANAVVNPAERFNNDYMNQGNMNYCQPQFYDSRFLPPPPPPPPLLPPPPPPPPPQPKLNTVPVPRRANIINLIDVQSISNEKTQKPEKNNVNKGTLPQPNFPSKEMNKIVVIGKNKSHKEIRSVPKHSPCEVKRNSSGDCTTAVQNLRKVCGFDEIKPTSAVPKKYSPPILPIPSVQKSMEILSLLHSLTNNFQNNDAFRSQVSPKINQTNPQGNKSTKQSSVVKVTSEPVKEKTKMRESLKDVKKISLDEYKKRAKNYKFIDLTGDDETTMKNAPIKKVYATNNNNKRQSVDSQDLGYDSDSTIKL